MELKRIDLVQDDTPRFPLRLLIAGYGTGALAATAVFLNDGGLMLTGMIFWLGGAIATLAWGLLQVAACKKSRARNPLSSRGEDLPEVMAAAE